MQQQGIKTIFLALLLFLPPRSSLFLVVFLTRSDGFGVRPLIDQHGDWGGCLHGLSDYSVIKAVAKDVGD